jgi:hypothetical protein
VIALRAAILALVGGAVAAPAASAGGGVSFGVDPASGGIARAAAPANVLTLSSTDINNRITAFTRRTAA